MKFTYSWLKEHLDTKASPAEIADKLTAIGLEVDDFTDLGKKYEPFIVAEIQEAEKHPNADKLRVCKVNNGTEVIQIVCGAPNARAGIKVCLAPVGALIPNGNFQIKKSKIRDVESNGMLCSSTELELGTDSEEIMELPADAKVGSKFADLQGLNDSLYEINITPNRADCLGVHGVARDLAAAGMGKLIALDSPKIQHNGPSPIKISGADYYLGCYIKNTSNGESCDTKKLMLKSIGQAPISFLVDTTNLSTFELGRPLHVYDADKLKGNITVRHAKKGEKINALNNKTYELDGELIVADDSGPIALAGVIGNVETSVDANTKNVFLEVAYFDPAEVAKSGRKHQIDSDARYRFERGIDVNFIKHAADLAVTCIGGEASEYVICGEEPKWQREIPLNLAKLNTFTHLNISQTDAEKILGDLGFKIAGNKVTPPSWRADIEGEADLAEEILRIVGYDKVPTQVLPFAPRVKVDNNSKLRKTLSARGLVESVTYTFMEPKTAAHFGGGNAALQLQNPISAELAEMRPSILPNLLQAAVRNSNRGFENIALFEVGPVFAGGTEQKAVTGIRVGQTAAQTIYGKGRKIDAFDAKADAIAIFASLGVAEPQIKEDAPSYYHPGRSGSFYLGKNLLGYFGEIHPAIAKKLDIEGNAVGFEIFLEKLPNSVRKYKKFEASDLQSVTRDFAFILPREVRAGDIAPKVRKTEQLITDVTVFDVYEGDKLDKDKKSVAISVTIQPKDKTLTDQEIESISQKIINAVSSELKGMLRT